MDWVSFDEIKKTVSLKMVIDHYGILLRPSGPNKLRGLCPLPSHSSHDSKESFIATLDKGVGGAWSCHSSSCAAARGGKVGGNLLDLVAAIERCSIRDAAIKLQSWFLVPAAGQPPTRKPVNHPANEREEKLVPENGGEGGENEPNKPLGFELQNIDHAHLYLEQRGITEATARHFGVGLFLGKGSMHLRCVMPIHNVKGELVAYAGRSIDGTEPRYKFPLGFRKSELFNLHRVKGELCVVLVEGFFDCMKISQAGYPCVALMGSTMTKAQEDLIAEYFGSVILMLDGDEAGHTATEIIRDKLVGRVFLVRTVDLDDGVQPDQLTKREIVAQLESFFL